MIIPEIDTALDSPLWRDCDCPLCAFVREIKTHDGLIALFDLSVIENLPEDIRDRVQAYSAQEGPGATLTIEKEDEISDDDFMRMIGFLSMSKELVELHHRNKDYSSDEAQKFFADMKEADYLDNYPLDNLEYDRLVQDAVHKSKNIVVLIEREVQSGRLKDKLSESLAKLEERPEKIKQLMSTNPKESMQRLLIALTGVKEALTVERLKSEGKAIHAMVLDAIQADMHPRDIITFLYENKDVADFEPFGVVFQVSVEVAYENLDIADEIYAESKDI